MIRRRVGMAGKGMAVAAALMAALAFADGWDPRSQAPNVITETPDNLGVGSIVNTRHNLTMAYNGQAWRMDDFRNDYVEVCVYCHTPHGANQQAPAPLWNRTVVQRSYQLYQPTSDLELAYSQPGPSSLTCLSCHDGFTAIDSVINMPTRQSGAFAGYNATQEDSVDASWLDAWSGAGTGHVGLSTGSGSGASPCVACHNAPNPTLTAPDFGAFVIGADFDPDAQFQSPADYLADDHPVGVAYPTDLANADYNEPTVKQARIAFFDRDGDGHADPNEIRLYDSGEGYEVECASCHDPHGIRVKPGSDRIIPSFLRVGRLTSDIPNGSLLEGNDEPVTISGNAASELCLTCHVK